MLIRFEWDKTFELGHPDIDRQHREIVELADGIGRLEEKAALQRAVMQLFQHVRTHFRDEEDLMRSSEYPDFESHRAMHEHLIEGLNKQATLRFDDEESVLKLRQFVYDWVSKHLQDHDRRMISWFQAQSLKTIAPSR